MAEEQPAEQPKVTVTLKVAMSEADIGHAAVAGDTVEVPADVAARWVEAGICEPLAGAAPASEDAPAPRVPRRNASA